MTPPTSSSRPSTAGSLVATTCVAIASTPRPDMDLVSHGVLGSTYRQPRPAPPGEGHLGDVERIDVVGLDTGVGTYVVRVIADRRRERQHRGVAGTASVRVTRAPSRYAVDAVVLGASATARRPRPPSPSARASAHRGRRRTRRVKGEIDRVAQRRPAPCVARPGSVPHLTPPGTGPLISSSRRASSTERGDALQSQPAERR